MRFTAILCVLIVAATLTGAFTASAASTDLPRPSGPVILTIMGAIDLTNGPGRADFDRAMLEAVGLSRITTSTPWTDHAASFEGVLVRDVLARVGARGTVVTGTALNDYAADMPVSDFTRFAVLLALKMDGEYMRVRDKGPIWIVYPMDDHADLRTSETELKMIWQLRTLSVR